MLVVSSPHTVFKRECQSPIGLESVNIQTNHWTSSRKPNPWRGLLCTRINDLKKLYCTLFLPKVLHFSYCTVLCSYC